MSMKSLMAGTVMLTAAAATLVAAPEPTPWNVDEAHTTVCGAARARAFLARPIVDVDSMNLLRTVSVAFGATLLHGRLEAHSLLAQRGHRIRARRAGRGRPDREQCD